jgi:hypothetical protein
MNRNTKMVENAMLEAATNCQVRRIPPSWNLLTLCSDINGCYKNSSLASTLGRTLQNHSDFHFRNTGWQLLDWCAHWLREHWQWYHQNMPLAVGSRIQVGLQDPNRGTCLGTVVDIWPDGSKWIDLGWLSTQKATENSSLSSELSTRT